MLRLYYSLRKLIFLKYGSAQSVILLAGRRAEPSPNVSKLMARTRVCIVSMLHLTAVVSVIS